MFLALEHHARRNAHRQRQVRGSQPAAIHTGGGQNCFGVIHGLDALDLYRDKELFIDPFSVIAAIDARPAPPPRARANGRKAAGVRRSLGLFWRVDHRHNNAQHALVEQATDQRVVVARDTRHRHRRTSIHRDQRGRGRLIAPRTMLAVQEKEVDTGMAQRFDGGG